MKRPLQQFFGTDPRFWTGVVEDRADPLQLGRSRVRVHGYHTFNKSLIPTKQLPWAPMLMPGTTAALDGVGKSPTGIMNGSLVLGMWLDGSDCQIPFIFGTINQIQQNPAFCYSVDSKSKSPTVQNASLNLSDGERFIPFIGDESLPEGIANNNPLEIPSSITKNFSGLIGSISGKLKFSSPEQGLSAGFSEILRDKSSSLRERYQEEIPNIDEKIYSLGYDSSTKIENLWEDIKLGILLIKLLVYEYNGTQPYTEKQIEASVINAIGGVSVFEQIGSVSSQIGGILGNSKNIIQDSFFGLPGNFFSGELPGILSKGLGELGTKPFKNGQYNPRILEYIKNGGGLSTDAISWGSAFVNWAGGGGSGLPQGAQQLLSGGIGVPTLKIGSKVVGNVPPFNDRKVSGIFMGMRGGMIQLLGAAKSDAVGIFSLSPNLLAGIRK